MLDQASNGRAVLEPHLVR